MGSKPFDVTLKDLIEDHGRSWATLAASAPVRRVTLIDADISTLTAAADKVLRVEDDHGEWLLNLEAEARHAADAPERLHLYGTVLHHRHQLPVRGVVVL